MILPKQKLSWSHIDLFQTNKKQYTKRYILGEPLYDTPHMKFGKDISDQLESGIKDPVLQYLWDQTLKLPIPEYKLETELENYGFIGYLDRTNVDLSVIEEYKTSVDMWSKEKADNHIQPVLYAGMASHKQQQFRDREVILYCWETGYDITGNLFLTGEWVRHPRTVKIKEQEKVLKWFVKLAKEIENYYISWVNKNITI